ncbi:MAG TPA: DUF3341 domain-containing protein [Dyella sp.]|uniref:DUF3341 domain-containing protein n=1 Tax=Dyella sp. TaxID=1869338 RepID=UPI002F950080
MSGLERYGVMAIFDSPESLRAAIRAVSDAGCRNVEAYTPFAVEELDESLPFPRSRLPCVMLIAGAAAMLGMLALQYYSAVVDYPVHVGGRPLASWPAFLPAAFEVGLLAAAVAGVIGMFVGNGLPRLHHPVFDVEAFARVSQDRFALLVRDRRPVDEIAACLVGCGAESIIEVHP